MKKLPTLLSFSVAAVAVSLLCGGQARAQQVQVPPTPKPLPQNIVDYATGYVNEAAGNTNLFYGRNQGELPRNMESMYLRERNSEKYDGFGLEELPVPVAPHESYSVGTIFHDGVLYPAVTMRLDLYRDEMVVTRPGGFGAYGTVIDPERFGWADLRGYRIIYLPPPVAGTDLASGYYQQLNEGRHRILKRERFLFDSNNFVFPSRTVHYYIEKDGVFHRVDRSKGSVLRLLRDQRRELNRYIRTNGIRVRRDMERAVVDIVAEYERLNYR